MDPQLQELATEIADAVEKRLKEHLDKFEQRTELRMKMHFENLESSVKLVGEGYSVALDGIERRLTEINTKFDTKFGDHDRALADHGTRITALEKHQ